MFLVAVIFAFSNLLKKNLISSVEKVTLYLIVSDLTEIPREIIQPTKDFPKTEAQAERDRQACATKKVRPYHL